MSAWLAIKIWLMSVYSLARLVFWLDKKYPAEQQRFEAKAYEEQAEAWLEMMGMVELEDNLEE